MTPCTLRPLRVAVLLVVAACAPTPLAPVPPPLPASAGAASVDRVVVLKAQRELLLLHDGATIRAYPVALGFAPVGTKRASGDGRTPEGVYVVDGRNEASPYHRSLHLSYPSEEEKRAAAAEGRDPGGDIAIHGMPLEYGRHDPVRFYRDWTDGCVAVGNLAIEEIWALVPDGTPVEIRP